ncbi:hypothetical protein ACPPVO_22025 [Dactylosporangium sp. McL0621]|uniref:hypothetical protein n=1 Tax=Dactylosporangium sp. McL0621 TaxID=3415678 RepID=UPI003CF6CA1E
MDRGGRSRVGAIADPPSDALALGELLCSLDSLDDLARWRDEVINLHRQVILGTSAAPDVASCACNGAGSRVARPVATATLEALLAAGIDRMRENGELAVDADPARLATGLTAALQGGSLLAKTTRDIAPLEAALDAARNCLRSHSAG